MWVILSMMHAFSVCRKIIYILHDILNIWLICLEFPSCFIIIWAFWWPLKYPVSNSWCWEVHLRFCYGLPSAFPVHRTRSVILTSAIWNRKTLILLNFLCGANCIYTLDIAQLWGLMISFLCFTYVLLFRFWPAIDSALREAACVRGVEVKLLVSCWSHSPGAMFVFLQSLSVLNKPPLSCNIHTVRFSVFFILSKCLFGVSLIMRFHFTESFWGAFNTRTAEDSICTCQPRQIHGDW